MRLAPATDNRGNAYRVTNHKAKNDSAANRLMVLALLQYHSQGPLRLTRTYREQNTWADQLTHEDYNVGRAEHVARRRPARNARQTQIPLPYSRPSR